MHKKVIAIFFLSIITLIGGIVYFFLFQQKPYPFAATKCTFKVQLGANKLAKMAIVGPQVWVWAIGTDIQRNRTIFRLNFDGTEAAPPIDVPDSIDATNILDTGNEVWVDSEIETKPAILRFNYDGSSAGIPIKLPEDKVFPAMTIINSQLWLFDEYNTLYQYSLQGNLLNEPKLNLLNENAHALSQIEKDIWILSGSTENPKIIRYETDSEITGNGLTIGSFNEITKVGNQIWVTSDSSEGAISRFNLDGTVADDPIPMQVYGLASFSNQAWVSNGNDNVITVLGLDGKQLNNCGSNK